MWMWERIGCAETAEYWKSQGSSQYIYREKSMDSTLKLFYHPNISVRQKYLFINLKTFDDS